MTMSSHSPRYISATRAVLLIALLTFGCVSRLSAVNAEDYPVLDGSGYEVLSEPSVDYQMLTGSGYEGHTPVLMNEGETTRMDAPVSTDSVLDGSGYEVSVTMAAHDQDRTAISDRDASTYAARIDAILDGSGYEIDTTAAVDAG